MMMVQLYTCHSVRHNLECYFLYTMKICPMLMCCSLFRDDLRAALEAADYILSTIGPLSNGEKNGSDPVGYSNHLHFLCLLSPERSLLYSGSFSTVHENQVTELNA